MKAAVLVCCFLTVSLTETNEVSRPAATMASADAFSSDRPPTPPGPANTTTPGPANTTTPGPANTTTPGPANTTSPGPANTTSPGPANTTTPGPANTTTPGPANTTSPGPANTTTPGPTNTTSPGPANTTTPGPTNTTSPGPAPPPAPTPPANLTVGNYTLMRDKALCLMAVMALQIRVRTPKANGTFIVQPGKTTTRGGCTDSTANLTLVFREGFITFLYNKSTEDNTVYVHALKFRLSYSFLNEGNGDYQADNTTMHLFAAGVGHSYSCRAESLDMGRGLFLDVDQDRMQAFNLTKANEFGSPEACPADRPSYRVAVVVGVLLLLLVLVGVLVYLLGHRRRRSDGYQPL